MSVSDHDAEIESHSDIESTMDEEPSRGSARKAKKTKADVCVNMHIIHPWTEPISANMTVEEVNKGILCADLHIVADYYNKNFATDESATQDILGKFGEGLLRYLSQDTDELKFHMCLALFMKLTHDANGVSSKNSFLCFLPVAVKTDGPVQQFHLAKGAVSQVDGTKETEQKAVKPAAWVGFDPHVFPTAMYIKRLSDEIKRGNERSDAEQEEGTPKLEKADFNSFLDLFDMLQYSKMVYPKDSASLALGRYSMKYVNRKTEAKYYVALATNNTKSWKKIGSLGGMEMQLHNWIEVRKLSEMISEAEGKFNALTEKNSKASLQTEAKSNGSHKRRASELESEHESGSPDAGPLDVNDKAEGIYASISNIVTDMLAQIHPRPAGATTESEMKRIISIKHDFNDHHPLRIHAKNLTSPEICKVSDHFMAILELTLLNWKTYVPINAEDPASVLHTEAPALLHGTQWSNKAFPNMCKVRGYLNNMALQVSTNSTTFAAICITIPELVMKRAIVTLMIHRFEGLRRIIFDILNIIQNTVKDTITAEFTMSLLYSLSYFFIHSMQEWSNQHNKFDIPHGFKWVTTAPLRPLTSATRLQGELDYHTANKTPSHVIIDPVVMSNAEARVHTISFFPHSLVHVDTKWTIGAEKKTCIKEHMLLVASVESKKPENTRKSSGVLTTVILPLGLWTKKVFKEEGGLHEKRRITRSMLDEKTEQILRALKIMIDNTFPVNKRNQNIPWKHVDQTNFKNAFMLEYATDIAYNGTRMVFAPSDGFYAGKLPQDVQDLIYGVEGFNQSVWGSPEWFNYEFEGFMDTLGRCSSVSDAWSDKFQDTAFKAIMFLATIPAYSLDRERKTIQMARIPVFVTSEGNKQIKVNPRYMHLGYNQPTRVEGEEPIQLTDEEFAAIRAPPAPRVLPEPQE